MQRCGRHLSIGTAALVLVMCGGLASAQGSTTPASSRTGGQPASRTAPAGAAPTRRSAVVLPTATSAAVVVATTATGLSIVRVAVPPALPGRSRVTYTVTPTIDGALVGKLTGSLTPAVPGVERSILFAVRSPRHVSAGQVQVAQVRFSTGSAAVEVPVIAQVATIRGIGITPTSRLVAARGGAPVVLGYRLGNLGNAADTVTVSVVVPVGWRVQDISVTIPIVARQSIDRSATILPPPDASGTSTVRLVVMARGQPVAEAPVDVQVGASATVVAAGPTLRTGIAAASGPWHGVTAIESVELLGSISDGVSIMARAATTPSQGIANYAFSRANLASTPFAMQLTGTDWRLDAGTLGASVSDLAGVNLVGRGASVAIKRQMWSASAVAATPDLGTHDTHGSLAATRVEYNAGLFSLSTALTRLRESRGASDRALDAWSLGGRHDDFLGGRWNGEVARRQVNGQARPGWSASYERRAPDENLSLRYVRAPGGTSAFARATNELAIDAGRRINPGLHLTGSAWRTEDDGAATLTGLSMEGWRMGAHLALTKDARLSLTTHRSAFGASTRVGAFGSGERAIDASLDVRRGAVTTQLTLNAALLRRHGMLEGPTDTRFAQEAPRGSVRAMVGTSLERGHVAVTGQYERTGAGIGAAPVQWSYGVEFSGTPDIGIGDALRVDAAVERVGGSLDVSQAMTLRAGVEMELPFQASLRLNAERNPYILPQAGGSAWMYVVGMTRLVSLPRLRTGGTQGLVYRDLNGNGHLDAGEPGLAGVALRRDADFSVTDSRGVFRLAGNKHESFEVDARSLPLGWIMPTTRIAAGTRQLGAVSVSPLIVTLALDAADSGRVAPSELAQLGIVARDSAGREWMSRRTSDSTVVFDALPPGTYSVDIDASASREPLRPVSESRSVIVASGRAAQPLRITLRARQLRFSNPKRKTS